MFSSLLVFLLLYFAEAQVPGLGSCPRFTVQPNFDANRYLGLWYEVEKYPFIFTIGGKCVTAEYGLRSDGKISVFNKQIRNGREDTIIGSARLTKPGFGVLGVSFPSVPCELSNKFTEINILLISLHF